MESESYPPHNRCSPPPAAMLRKLFSSSSLCLTTQNGRCVCVLQSAYEVSVAASPRPLRISQEEEAVAQGRTVGGRAGFPLFCSLLPRVRVSVAALPLPLPTILWKTGLEVEMLATTGREPVCFSLLDFCSRRLPSSRRTDGIQECTPVSLLPFRKSSPVPQQAKKNVFQAFLSFPCPAQYKNT